MSAAYALVHGDIRHLEIDQAWSTTGTGVFKVRYCEWRCAGHHYGDGGWFVLSQWNVG